MSDMKCPYCNEELEICSQYTDGTSMLHCNKCGLVGENRLFDEIIRTRKALDKANAELEYINEQVEKSNVFDNTRKELEQSEICCAEWEKQALDYKAENIVLSGRLDIAVRAFKIVRDCCSDYSIECLARETLEQITEAKE